MTGEEGEEEDISRLDPEEEDRKRRHKMEEEVMQLMGKMYEKKEKQASEVASGGEEAGDYPGHIIEMLGRLYNQSRGNEEGR